MLTAFFKHSYIVRRFGAETIVDGFSGSEHTDFPVRLDVQPLNSDELQALPEGERTVRRLKALGDDRFSPADEEAGTPGDWLYYDGRWFECKSCQVMNLTILSHYESEFVLVPPGPNTEPPEEEVEE